MAYTYRNKKTGDLITLSRKANTAFWEEVEPERDETSEEETFEEETFEAEEAPKKSGRGRGKK